MFKFIVLTNLAIAVFPFPFGMIWLQQIVRTYSGSVQQSVHDNECLCVISIANMISFSHGITERPSTHDQNGRRGNS